VDAGAQCGEHRAEFVFGSTDFASLVTILRFQFGITDDAQLTVRYYDEDGDLVTISTPDELELAARSHRADTALRLVVTANGFGTDPSVF